MRIRVVVGLLLGLVTTAAVALVALRDDPMTAPLEPNEAIAVLPLVDGIRVGTPVTYALYPKAIGRVAHLQRRQDDLVVRLRFDGDSGISRRRGDAIRVRRSGPGELTLAVVAAPTYEKTRATSDTLFELSTTTFPPPSTVEALLAGLYRPRLVPDSSPRR